MLEKRRKKFTFARRKKNWKEKSFKFSFFLLQFCPKNSIFFCDSCEIFVHNKNKVFDFCSILNFTIFFLSHLISDYQNRIGKTFHTNFFSIPIEIHLDCALYNWAKWQTFVPLPFHLSFLSLLSRKFHRNPIWFSLLKK